MKRVAISSEPGGRPVRYLVPEGASWEEFLDGCCERLRLASVDRVVEASSLSVELSRTEDLLDGDSLVVCGPAEQRMPTLSETRSPSLAGAVGPGPRAPPLLLATRQSSGGSMRVADLGAAVPDWAGAAPEGPPLFACQQSSGGGVHLLASAGLGLFRGGTSPSPSSPSARSPSARSPSVPSPSASPSPSMVSMASPVAAQRRTSRLRVEASASPTSSPGPQPSPVFSPPPQQSQSQSQSHPQPSPQPSPRRFVIDRNGDEWMATENEAGRTYYYNRRTRETSWRKPRT